MNRLAQTGTWIRNLQGWRRLLLAFAVGAFSATGFAPLQFFPSLLLGSGVLVLYAALLSTRDERVREAAVMRALGATRRQVLAAQRAEFVVLGLLAGLLAAVGATAIGWLIAQKVFDFPYQINHWVWLAGPLFGLVCLGVNLRAAAQAVLNTPPLAALRDA